MTRATILQLRDEYAAILDHAGAVAEHIYDTRHVVRALEDQQMMLNHARWVCDEILRQIDNLGGASSAYVISASCKPPSWCTDS